MVVDTSEAAVLHLGEEVGAADHPGLESACALGEAFGGALTPGVGVVAVACQCSFEHTRVAQHDERADVAETERGQGRRLHVAGSESERGAQPHQVGCLRLDERVDAVQRGVRREVAGCQDVDKPAGLQQRRTCLGVTGEGLLRDDVHRCIRVAANGRPQHGVQFGLVRIVGVGGGVVLGQDGDIIRRESQRGQGSGQARVGTAAGRRQHAEAWCRDGGVCAVAEAGGVRDHCQHRQAELGGEGAAGEQDRAAAFGFEEATASTVVSA